MLINDARNTFLLMVGTIVVQLVVVLWVRDLLPLPGAVENGGSLVDGNHGLHGGGNVSVLHDGVHSSSCSSLQEEELSFLIWIVSPRQLRWLCAKLVKFLALWNSCRLMHVLMYGVVLVGMLSWSRSAVVEIYSKTFSGSLMRHHSLVEMI